MARPLIIAGITLARRAGLRLSQRYDNDTGGALSRMGDGATRKQTLYPPKIATTIRGTGMIPHALDGVDWSQPFTLSCIQPRAINSASPNIALPLARRTDAAGVPIGRAFIGDRPVRMACAVVADVAQITPHPDATGYQVLIFPEFLAFSEKGPTSDQTAGDLFEWSIDAVER